MHPESLAKDVSPRTRGMFLKSLADFQTELARVHAGFIPGVPVWSVRKEMPMLVFRSMRRIQDLRARGRELGISFAEMHHSAAVPRRDVIACLCEAGNAADLLQAGMITVPAVLVQAIEQYLAQNDSVYDLPSVPLLEGDRDELNAQQVWAQKALVALAEVGIAPDPAFDARVAALIGTLAGDLQHAAARGGAVVRHGRRHGNLPLADAALPHGFIHLEYGPEGLAGNSTYADRARYHAVNFLQEVQAADSCASMLFEAPDMPWDFYLDLSRHLWDESRHAMFGETKLADLGTTAMQAGLSTKAYALRQTLSPLDRYAALATQEADAFPGKHAGLKDAVAHGDSVSAMAWSYDIADETQHVRFGNKWIPVMLEKVGDPRSFEQVKQDACTWRSSVLAEVYKPAATALAS